jgi:hypothetical protein
MNNSLNVIFLFTCTWMKSASNLHTVQLPCPCCIQDVCGAEVNTDEEQGRASDV